MLLKNDFSLKAVSKLMGHAKELITVDVYGDNRNIIPDEIPELLSYMEDNQAAAEWGRKQAELIKKGEEITKRLNEKYTPILLARREQKNVNK